MSDRLFEDPVSLFGFNDAGRQGDQVAIVEAARQQFRRRLPELRKLPGCPAGSDDDIIAMSYPPYYTACPNPFIAEWLETLERPSDEGRVDPGPFASDVSVGKGNAFYKAHSYPTKVPHPAIMRFILHYTQPGDVVLDGFAGSGMTGVAAQACGMPDPKTKAEIEAELGPSNIKWGARRAILGDLGPSATFIASGMNLPVDGAAFDKAAMDLLRRLDDSLGWMYRTKVAPDRGKPFVADINYTVWSQVFTCPHCGGRVVFYEAAFETSTGTVAGLFPCESCGASLTKRQLEVRFTTVRTLAGDTVSRVEFQPVLIEWRRDKSTGVKRVDDDDRAVLTKVAALSGITVPTDRIPVEKMVHDYAFILKGVTHVHHLWPDRSLATLGTLWSWAAEVDDPLLGLALRFWIEQAFWGLSWMNRYKANDHSQVNRQMTGVYYIPALVSECSAAYNLGGRGSRGKLKSLSKTWESSPSRLGNVVVSTGSSTSLTVPDESVDYVFVDPPFGANIPYSDLAMVVEMWHRVDTDDSAEATEDSMKGRGLDEYADLMTECFLEFFRVLKPGRWMTVEFSNHSNAVWLQIQNALASAGFVVADTRIIDKQELSYKQVTSINAVKHDLVISAYKPAAVTEHTFEIASGNADGAWAFVREHLSRVPATEGVHGKALVVRERQADRIYERMVGYHVARNTLVPMTAAEFYAGLEQRFPVRDAMYFLPDQVEAYERFRITFKELAAQTFFIRDESSAIQWLRQLLKDRPRSYADIHPLFVRELQSGLASWEDLPELRMMLEANFVSDDKGRWSVPDPEKSEHLDQLRTRALLGEFAVYASWKGPLTRFRSEAVRAGFKDAWGRKDFAAIVSIGRRLPNDVFIEDSALLHYYRNAEKLAT